MFNAAESRDRISGLGDIYISEVYACGMRESTVAA